jgi:putative copper resistance protein D
MHLLYLVSVWLHVIAATAWVGGMLFLVVVVVPVLRRPEIREHAPAVFHATGVRFRLVGWIALGTLVTTGTFNLLYRGFTFGQIVSGEVFQGHWGTTLATKLTLVAIILVMSAVHDFWVGPTAVNAEDPVRREKFRKGASVFGRVNFALALAVVALAITLVRG